MSARGASLAATIVFAGLVQAGVAWSSPFAYITNQGDNTVSVIDTANNRVIRSIDVGDKPAGIAVSDDGSRIYVTNPKSRFSASFYW